jgi:hypothetical protein
MSQLTRFLLYIIVAGLFLSGCKKKVENAKEDLLIKLIVSSQWVVTKYSKGSTDVTGDFSPYSFQFKTDFTVDAINNNIVEKTGTWNGSIATKTINSNFPNPNPILELLNGTWLITDSGLTYVESKQTINGESCFLRLVKK